jgi:SAM-dependent methyltransferase
MEFVRAAAVDPAIGTVGNFFRALRRRRWACGTEHRYNAASLEGFRMIIFRPGSPWKRGLAATMLVVWPAAIEAQAAADHRAQTRPSAHQHQEGEKHGHDHDARASHSFEDVERWVAVFESPERAAWQKPAEIPGAIGVKPGMVVADIGAGTGYFVPHLSRAVGPGGKVLAVDIEPNLVDYMTKRFERERLSNATAVLAEPHDPKLPEAGVDRVFICNTWHHIDDRLSYLARLAGALKPGGLLAVVDFHKRPLPVGPPPEHKMAREEVMAELAEAGWTLAGESDLLPHQYILLFAPPAP